MRFFQLRISALVLAVASGAHAEEPPVEAPVPSEAPAPAEPAPSDMPAWDGKAVDPAPAVSPAEAKQEVHAEPTTSSPAASPTRPTDEGKKTHNGRFAFGSYGRVRAASNLRGKSGQSSNIVAFGQRNDLDNYAELELRREDTIDELELRVVATMAFAGDFFHYDGEFQEQLAIRNLFADVDNVFVRGLAFWAGSRMVRGDDVYLLNFWPMDNLNLIGGGTRYTSSALDLMLSAGLTRPNNPFYKQGIDVPPAFGFTPQNYNLLDRPRSVVAAKATYFPLGKAETAFKASLYAEGHRLPSGTRETETDQRERLPGDSGYVIGAQLGGWLKKPKTFVNLFARYASGVAVYDPLSTPMQVGTVTTTSGAREWRLAISSNVELGSVGIQFGGYLRGLRDESSTPLAGGKLLEGAVDVRPYFWFLDYAGVSLNAGYQALALSTLDDRTGKQVQGSVGKFAVMPFISPYGKGTYTRPHIHLIYQLSVRDDGARRLYPERDVRSKQSTEHFLAVGAEWWFDSTSY